MDEIKSNVIDVTNEKSSNDKPNENEIKLPPPNEKIEISVKEKVDAPPTSYTKKEETNGSVTPSVTVSAAKIFGLTEKELEREFNGYKVEKLLKKMDYFIEPKISDKKFSSELTESRRFGFGSVTVLPSRVRAAVEKLKGSQVKVFTVIAYPFGEETKASYMAGVKALRKTEVDGIGFSISSSNFSPENYRVQLKESKKLVKAAKKKSVFALVDIDGLNPAELIAVVKLCLEAGVATLRLKTSNETSIEKVTTIKELCRGKIILEYVGKPEADAAIKLYLAGAGRISAFSAKQIAEELLRQVNA